MDKVPDPWKTHRSISLKRNVLPHIALEQLAHDSLGKAEAASGKDRMYWCVAAMTFAALSVEAFLNVVGEARVKRWVKDIERNASPHAKLPLTKTTLDFKQTVLSIRLKHLKGSLHFGTLWYTRSLNYLRSSLSRTMISQYRYQAERCRCPSGKNAPPLRTRECTSVMRPRSSLT